MNPREKDQFERIARVAQLERIDEFFVQYWENMTTWRGLARDHAYEIGKIDQRLEDSS